MYARVFNTGFGWMAVASRGQGVSHVLLPSRSKAKIMREVVKAVGEDYGSTRELMALESDLLRYFNGRAVDFSGYQVDYTYSTGFQKRVWIAAREVSYGRTMTYGELAEKIGEPNAARAVGAALNENPVPILIPCHRVVASRGIGGFSAGTTLKKRMLKLEGAL